MGNESGKHKNNSTDTKLIPPATVHTNSNEVSTDNATMDDGNKSEMMSLTKKQLDELLVYGYIRREFELDIPEDIMDLCVLWYHIASYFLVAGKHCTFNDDYTICEYNNDGSLAGDQANSCYGSVLMASMSDIDFEYKYRVKILQFGSIIGIGIDDGNCKHIDANYTLDKRGGELKHYSYLSNTGLYKWGDNNKCTRYGVEYRENDVITMIYNPYKHTLEFKKNGQSQGLIENIYGDEELSYRLCIYMGWNRGQQRVQLIE